MADNGLPEFSKRIIHLAAEVTEGASRVVRKCALAIDQAVVLATPVDTGRARSNWIVQVNAPFKGVRGPYVPGSAKSTGPQNAQAALDQGMKAVASYKTPEGSIFISNGLSYIGRLNEGHSKQAPALFIEKAVRAGIEAVKGAKVLDAPKE